MYITLFTSSHDQAVIDYFKITECRVLGDNSLDYFAYIQCSNQILTMDYKCITCVVVVNSPDFIYC